MRRYRGVDKAPGPSVSPPPQRRQSTGSGPMYLQPGVTSLSKPPAGANHGRASTPMESNPLMVTGSGASSFFMDPRTKQPVLMPPMPQAGRSIPKLKMTDLTSSLSPLMEPEIIVPKVPITKADKRIAATVKDVTGPPKDMLESFDDALRAPDMRAINSKVAQLKRGIGVPNQLPKLSLTRPNNVVGVKSKTSSVGSGGGRKQSSAKVAGTAEELNMRVLMNQLKDKYLDDMESQLGLAIERRPKAGGGETLAREDQSGGDGPMEFGIPKPSTNATEITARIDKVVRDWAADSQRMSRSGMASPNVSKQASFHQASQKAQQDMATSPLASPKVEKETKKAKPDAVPAKNKNLASISNAFRKSLDPISKRDVRELINIPEDDHIEKLQEEHEERRRAHESVFQNAVIMEGPPASSKNKKETSGRKRASEPTRLQNEATPPVVEKQGKANNLTSGLEETRKEIRKPFADAIKAGKDDEDEVYTIIKEHMEYEMGSGPPKLSVTRKPSYSKVRQQSASLLRSDAAGKALLKYNDSHKKLQNLVDQFQEKVDAPTKRGPPAPSKVVDEYEDTFSDTSEIDEDKSSLLKYDLNASTGTSQTVLPSRKKVTLDVTATLSRSMKTIDRASTVAQRLGTLMSRVSLRNEKYDYEKQMEEEAQAATVSTAPVDVNGNLINPNSTSPGNKRTQSSMALAGPSGADINPFEKSSSRTTTNSGVNPIGGPNIPPGVSKLDSNQFGKYVKEMKKVAEKAADSFEKFKEKQLQDDDELPSSSEGEGEADLAPFQQQRSIQRNPGTAGRTMSTKVRNVDTGTSPREQQILINRGIKKVDDSDIEFKFIPDMSYTDQLMLQKLRKLKEKEGWGDSMNSQVAQIEQAADAMVGGDANASYFNPGEEMESLLKRASAIEIPKEVERPGMGAAVSLNAILRARMSSKGNPTGK